MNQDLMPEAMTRRGFLKAVAGLSAGALLPAWLTQLAQASPLSTVKTTQSATKRPNQFQPVGIIGSHQQIAPLNFGQRLKTVSGLSQNQLQQHLGLYEGYVKKFNSMTDKIKAMNEEDWEGANGTYHPFREIHVELSYAQNGALLHELYFGNMGGDKSKASPYLKMKLAEAFGSWESYLGQLNALGRSMRGWAITAYNLRDGKIHNYGLDTHNMFAPMNVIPLLVMDVYEHAYMIDYGTNRGKYLDAFIDDVDWSVVEARYRSHDLETMSKAYQTAG